VTEWLLEARGLTVKHGDVAAVRGVDLRVRRGHVLTVLGPNGAGKSTLLGALAGLLRPAAGEVKLDGIRVGGSVEDAVARGISLVPESRALFSGMSVEDNLELGAFPRRREGRRAREERLAEVYAIFPRLQERRRQLAGTLSGGERQMLALGRALMAAPRLLLLDEPSLGLAPRIAREIFQVMAELRRRGTSVLLVEQNARAALEVADDACVLEMGELKLSGSAAELARDPRVVESYLGV
jgi:branched-chain amino acid transport system ATP-binding protein